MGGTVAEVEIPVAEFALAETFTRLNGIRCEIERVVAHDDARVLPFVWISGEGHDTDDVVTALAEDTGVATFELLTDLDDEALYRMEWIDRVQTLVKIIVEEKGTVLAASGEAGTWALRLLFPEHEALSRTHDYCKGNGVHFDVQRIYRLDEGRQGRFGLTDKQQDTLAEAFEHGYYEIPRETTAKELGTELNISHQALSELLRRGHKNLVKNTIIVGRSVE